MRSEKFVYSSGEIFGREREHTEDLGTKVTIILKCIL
jgi:hypothetical protein